VTLRFASGSVVVALGVVLCCVAGNSTVAALASVTFSIRLRRHVRTLPDGTPTQIAGRPAVADDIVTRLRAATRTGDMPLGMSFDLVAVADLIEAQQAEIKRLRALIRFYADAHDGITLNWSVDRKGNWCLFDAVDKALLKEACRG